MSARVLADSAAAGPSPGASTTASPARIPHPGPDPFAAVRPQLDAVEAFIRGALQDETPLVGAVVTHILGGGKRLRPALVLLSGTAAGGAESRLIPVAAAFEITHLATLVHDDVIDGSEQRRGVASVHTRWGLPAALLGGDHLFARAFAILAAEGDPRTVGVLSDIVADTCAGEIEEVAAADDLDQATQANYRRRIRRKTGRFIAEACRAGALVAGAPAAWTEALLAYGWAVGETFQIVDDLLDLTSDATTLGKPAGADLRRGVYTLPVILALEGRHGPALRQLLQARPLDDAAVAAARRLLVRAGALRRAAGEATELVQRAQAALAALPETPARAALHDLAEDLARRVR